jgi:hypothetical protein
MPRRASFLRTHRTWTSVLLGAWTAVWMVAVPLVHVHPEADHRHGSVGHVHGGTVHTVFSPDLDCEQGDRHVARTAQGTESASASFLGKAGHSLGHDEIGFTFLSASPDRQHTKHASCDLCLSDGGRNPGELLPSRALARACPSSISLFLCAESPGRAPPVLSL